VLLKETKEEVQEAIKNADMIFITGGAGGGTCSGASPTLAQLAKESGVKWLGVDSLNEALELKKSNINLPILI